MRIPPFAFTALFGILLLALATEAAAVRFAASFVDSVLFST